MDYSAEQRLNSLTKNDPHYQQLLDSLQIAAAQYGHILKSLPTDTQMRLENYISLCEELEYRRTCLAYCLGTMDGAIRGCITYPD